MARKASKAPTHDHGAKGGKWVKNIRAALAQSGAEQDTYKTNDLRTLRSSDVNGDEMEFNVDLERYKSLNPPLCVITDTTDNVSTLADQVEALIPRLSYGKTAGTTWVRVEPNQGSLQKNKFLRPDKFMPLYERLTKLATVPDSKNIKDDVQALLRAAKKSDGTADEKKFFKWCASYLNDDSDLHQQLIPSLMDDLGLKRDVDLFAAVRNKFSKAFDALKLNYTFAQYAPYMSYSWNERYGGCSDNPFRFILYDPLTHAKSGADGSPLTTLKVSSATLDSCPHIPNDSWVLLRDGSIWQTQYDEKPTRYASTQLIPILQGYLQILSEELAAGKCVQLGPIGRLLHRNRLYRGNLRTRFSLRTNGNFKRRHAKGAFAQSTERLGIDGLLACKKLVGGSDPGNCALDDYLTHAIERNFTQLLKFPLGTNEAKHFSTKEELEQAVQNTLHGKPAAGQKKSGHGARMQKSSQKRMLAYLQDVIGLRKDLVKVTSEKIKSKPLAKAVEALRLSLQDAVNKAIGTYQAAIQTLQDGEKPKNSLRSLRRDDRQLRGDIKLFMALLGAANTKTKATDARKAVVKVLKKKRICTSSSTFAQRLRAEVTEALKLSADELACEASSSAKEQVAVLRSALGCKGAKVVAMDETALKTALNLQKVVDTAGKRFHEEDFDFWKEPGVPNKFKTMPALCSNQPGANMADGILRIVFGASDRVQAKNGDWEYRDAERKTRLRDGQPLLLVVERDGKILAAAAVYMSIPSTALGQLGMQKSTFADKFKICTPNQWNKTQTQQTIRSENVIIDIFCSIEKGCGKLLMGQVIKTAREQHKKHILVTSLSEAMDKTLQANGFQGLCERIANYDGEGSVDGKVCHWKLTL